MGASHNHIKKQIEDKEPSVVMIGLSFYSCVKVDGVKIVIFSVEWIKIIILIYFYKFLVSK